MEVEIILEDETHVMAKPKDSKRAVRLYTKYKNGKGTFIICRGRRFYKEDWTYAKQ